MSLFVVGMHRSGTSMLTGLLHLAGASVGDREGLTHPDKTNSKGFWEQNRVREISEGLLHSAGADWDLPLRFDPEAVDPQFQKTMSARATKVLEMFDSHSTWVVKDPRFCLTLPFWRRLVPELIPLLVFRNPLEVARSLFSRNSIPIPIGLGLWECYVLNSVQHSSGLARVVVQHQELLYETRAVLSRLIQSLTELRRVELSIPEESLIGEFVDPALHRFKAPDSELKDFLVPDQQEVWQAVKSGNLQVLEGRPLSPAARSALEGYEAMGMAFSRVKRLERELRAKLRQRGESLRGVSEKKASH